MYSLTVNFETLEDLAHYVEKQKAEVKIQVQEELPADIPPVIEEKKPAKKSTKKSSKKAAPKVEEEEEWEEVETIYSKQAKEPFDRDGAIATAQRLVSTLKETGIADADLMPAIHEVYAEANCPVNLKISQLSDEQLEVFIPLFESKVDSIVKAGKSSKQEASFI